MPTKSTQSQMAPARHRHAINWNSGGYAFCDICEEVPTAFTAEGAPSLERLIEAIPSVMARQAEQQQNTSPPEDFERDVRQLCAAGNRCPHCGMPMLEDGCHACFPVTRPSREAVVGIAVAKALQRFYPSLISFSGTGAAARAVESDLMAENGYGDIFVRMVREEFSPHAD